VARRTVRAKAPLALIADRKLYLTRDKERIVEEGSPEAAYLFANSGTMIPDAEAARLGLSVTNGRMMQAGTVVVRTSRKRKRGA
jgi:hypothetical protein